MKKRYDTKFFATKMSTNLNNNIFYDDVLYIFLFNYYLKMPLKIDNSIFQP